jgi:hypothetical protein
MRVLITIGGTVSAAGLLAERTHTYAKRMTKNGMARQKSIDWAPYKLEPYLKVGE